jgi:cytochrome c553
MKNVIRALGAGLLFAVAAAVLVRAAGMPLWAYGYVDPPPADSDYSKKCTVQHPVDCARGGTPTDDGRKRTLPGGTGQWTVTEIANDYGPVDWYPNEHPKMPEIVAHGAKERGIRACALCHFPNGSGKPENAPVAGTSVIYFMNQLNDFKNGLRHTSDKNKANAWEMPLMAAAMTPEEWKQAAEYFAAIKYYPKNKVVETSEIPKFAPNANNLFLPAPGSDKVPLGNRLIEMPNDPDDAQNVRNPHSPFTAYVPPGTLKKGEMLATTGGNGKTIRCDVCHGPGLRGLDPVPAIAGRQASYLARQLYDMQAGSRRGTWSPLMKDVVAKLTEDDMMALAAYVTSLPPQ